MKVAIIPARGGSKRIPRKNIKEFAGIPMIAHSLLAARASEMFDRILVSSDDQEILGVGAKYGAEPLLRPPELADDFAGTDDVMCHAVRFLMDAGAALEQACCIYATAPFITAEALRRGWETLHGSGKEYAFSVTTFPFPVQRAVRLTSDGGIEPLFPECVPMRSQDLEEVFHDAGQFYWGTARAWLERLPVFSSAAAPVILPRHRVQDIDTPEDWLRAELMYQALQVENA